MTISSENRKAGPYDGNDVTTSFPFSFKVFSDDEVVVVFTDEDGVETILSSGYSVTLNADQNANPGGSVEKSTALETGTMLTITSAVQNLQPIDLTNNGGFYPAVINQAFDRLTILAQQNAEQISRAVKTPISSGLTPDELLASIVESDSEAAESAAAAAISANNASGFADDAETSALAAAASAITAAAEVGALAVSSGAALVGFTQSGTGAVAQTVDSKLKQSISVKDFGAVGDGVADDTAAIQAALSSGAFRVDGVGVTCKVTSPLEIPDGVCLANIIIDFSAAGSSATCMTSTGAISDAVLLTADANANTSILAVSDATGIDTDKWLFLKSAKVYSTVSSVTQGEWVRVKSVAGLNVELYAPVHHSYTTADGASVATAVFNENVRLHNVSVVGSGSGGNQKGFTFTHCKNISIVGCTFRKTDNRGGEFISCLEFTVDRCVFGDHKESGLAYGVVPASASSYGSIQNSWFYNVKHGVASGGSNGVCRDIQVRGNHVYASEGGLDAHPGTEMVTFEGNFVYCDGVTAARDAININGRSAIVRGNRIFNAYRYGILFNPTQPSGYVSNVIIEGNEVRSMVSTGSAAVFVLSDTGSTLSCALIRGNKLDGYQYGIYARATAGADLYGAVVCDNVIGQTLPPSVRGIFVDVTTDGSVFERGAIANNIVNIGDAANGGIRVVGASSGLIDKVSITGNIVTGGAASAGGIITSGTNRIAVANNVVTVSGTPITLVGALSVQSNNITT